MRLPHEFCDIRSPESTITGTRLFIFGETLVPNLNVHQPTHHERINPLHSCRYESSIPLRSECVSLFLLLVLSPNLREIATNHANGQGSNDQTKDHRC
jgi:hypothetical protein